MVSSRNWRIFLAMCVDGIVLNPKYFLFCSNFFQTRVPKELREEILLSSLRKCYSKKGKIFSGLTWCKKMRNKKLLHVAGMKKKTKFIRIFSLFVFPGWSNWSWLQCILCDCSYFSGFFFFQKHLKQIIVLQQIFIL